LGLLQEGITHISSIEDAILIKGKDLNSILKRIKYSMQDIEDIKQLSDIKKEEDYSVLLLKKHYVFLKHLFVKKICLAQQVICQLQAFLLKDYLK